MAYIVSPQIKMSSSALSSILNKHNLTGENFTDWKRNLKIVLTFEKLNFVLNTPCPPESPVDAPNEVFVAYQRWKDSNDMTRCYMMASMSIVLQAQHEDYITARQIIDNLEDMFGGQAAEKRREALSNLINCIQKVGSSINEHMLKVMGYLAEVQTNGADIDAESYMNNVSDMKSLASSKLTSHVYCFSGQKGIVGLASTRVLQNKK
ncbi:uncharacterized protein LOC112091155 [Morus notabilis]|uniref:uncharacterized protein LOC112091155 n=1 Tax=Morus notabilis TaxID=981085 RepID=UPI000CED2FFB|nr:uncharacterized protein LOC112091155 [Morus notabilis]